MRGPGLLPCASLLPLLALVVRAEATVDTAEPATSGVASCSIGEYGGASSEGEGACPAFRGEPIEPLALEGEEENGLEPKGVDPGHSAHGHSAAAEALAAAAEMLAPRLTAMAVDEAHGPACGRPRPPAVCTDFGLPGRLLCAAVPQVVSAWRRLPCAAESLWTELAIASDALLSLRWEGELLWRLAVRPGSFPDAHDAHEAMDVVAHAGLGIAALAASSFAGEGSCSVDGGLGGCSIAAAVVAAKLLTVGCALKAATSPARSLIDGERAAAAAQAVVLALVVASAGEAAGGQELLALFVAAGPGAILLAAAGFGVHSAKVARAARLLVDRQRHLESSVDQLLRLQSPLELLEPPRIVYVSGGRSELASPGSVATGNATTASAAAAAHAAMPRETGVDTGGMRRDWISRLAGELFDPTQGIVERVVIDGVEHARLRAGGDLRRLQAAGRVLGLALRDNQPLGVHLAAPLTHLLAHPDLPSALDAVAAASSSSPSAAAAAAAEAPRWATPFRRGRPVPDGAAELRQLGFCREWLRWVSPEEYEYWDTQLRNLRGGSGGRTVSAAARRRSAAVCSGVAQRALETLVLDVAEEAKAMWRGLHEVPNVPLPSLEAEVRGSKRRRDELGADSDTPAALQEHARLVRRRRISGAGGRRSSGSGTGEEEEGSGGVELPAVEDRVDVGADEDEKSEFEQPDTPARAPAPDGAKGRQNGTGKGGPPTAAPAVHSEGPIAWVCRRRRSREEAGLDADDGASDGAADDGAKLGEIKSATPPAKRRRTTPPGGDVAEAGASPEDGKGAEETAEEGGRCPGSVLQKLVSGEADIAIDRWRSFTRYTPPGAEMSPEGRRAVAWFWKYVESLEREGRERLLQWVTGYRRLPIHGFAPPHDRMTLHLLDGQDAGRLPCAHTCALQLDLPMYGSELVLRNRLAEAVEHRDFHMS